MMSCLSVLADAMTNGTRLKLAREHIYLSRFFPTITRQIPAGNDGIKRTIVRPGNRISHGGRLLDGHERINLVQKAAHHD